eukprot:gnl/MRDRNA2_/MRDRNA2_100451_c0_seq1.p1 gnl/MRDRNA2_/MRDRNA2_100451_c0~~gnl/MRDRNA2_/MRDRNA2_100451_c0_seq1.p1  ORF type:complete len:396 (-),score=94.12 gnl/MRDRNA2_/MRDRNA2_100451_c0_seq1:102-1289(-)
MAPTGRSPAHDHLETLDSVFGPQYFEHGQLIITVARDIPGVMKVAHKLQTKVIEQFGSVLEVCMEHIKHQFWNQLHDASTNTGLDKGQEVLDQPGAIQVPEGIRVHPYKRPHLPVLEVLLLWKDTSGTTRGHCLSSTAYPEIPTEASLEKIFAEIEPFFAKRWLLIKCTLGSPIRGEFEDADAEDPTKPPHESLVGAGAQVEVLACHASGFAREPTQGVAHVTQCEPMTFKGISDDAGVVKLCFLPAEVNKIRVKETDRFHSTEMVIKKSELKSLDDGPTEVVCELTPKALASLSVHVFAMPEKLPATQEADGQIDWAVEAREAISGATVEITPDKEGSRTEKMQVAGSTGDFELRDLPEGCFDLVLTCPGFAPETRTVMLLVGDNEFYVPLKKA